MRIDYLAKTKRLPALQTDTARMIRRHRDRPVHRRIICDYRNAHPLCQRCIGEGRTTGTAEIHHIQPVADGGATEGANLLALCLECHASITAVPRDVQRTFKRF